MRGPLALVQHFQEKQYHPRSDAHSNVICRAILDDLLEHCPPFREKAERGEIVAKLNHTIAVSYQTWNIDLALGAPPGTPQPPIGGLIRWETPVTVQIAIEAKGVMTEHGKARRNRLRELQAFHHHAHVYNPETVAVGVVVVNLAETYWSPTRAEHDITHHHNIGRIGPETVAEFRNLPLRRETQEGPGLEAASVIVVDHDNLAKNPNPPPGTKGPRRTSLWSRNPAPQIGDPLHYSTMLQRICDSYRKRWT